MTATTWNVERVEGMTPSECGAMLDHYNATVEGLEVEAEGRDGNGKTTPTVGGPAWREACAERRAFVRAVAQAHARREGIALGEGAFDACEAPSGAGECVEGIAHVAARDTGYGPVPRGVRRIERNARVEGIARRSRRRVMLDARRIERMRRMALPTPIESMTPLDAMRDDIERGRYSLRSTPIIERVTLRDGKGIARGKTLIEAPARMVALERLTRDYDAERASLDSLMRHVPSGEGRGTVERAASSVNGTETRVSGRWHSTPRVAVMTCIEERNGIRCVAPIDWHCYRIEADGTRTRLVSSATAKRRKARAAVEASTPSVDIEAQGAERLALLALAGTLGVEAQG